MSDRCPSCRRTLAPADARCPRCGANVSGVEIEGLTPAFGGDEVVVDGRGSRPTRFGRRTIGALAAVMVIGLAAVATRGGGGAATTASTVTPPTIHAVDGASSTTTSTEPPTTAVTDAAPTTSTTVVQREVTLDDLGAQVSMTTSIENDPLALRLPSRLSMTTIAGGETAFVRFDELDTGRQTIVSVRASRPGAFTSAATAFPGGAAVVVSVGDATSDPSAVERSVFVYANGAVRDIPGVGGPVKTFVGGSGFTSPAWFEDSDDPHTVHLVDLTAATVVRSLTLPRVVVPVGIDGPTLVVGDPSGQLYDLADDGSLAKRSLGIGQRSAGRRSERSCTDALGSCVLDYVDEAGNRTTIVDADHALTSAAVVAPSGPHLAAVVPLVSCRRSCSGTGAPAPLTVHDVDRGVSYAVGSTTATALEFLFQSGFNDYPVTWSSDGTWLFFPEQNADGSPVTRAWRPGLLAPVEITNLQLSSLLGRGGSVVFPGDTPMPAPAG